MAGPGLLLPLVLLVYIITVSDYIYAATATTSTTTTTTTTTTTGTANGSLACYDCSETFKYTWEPYTECQYYPKQAPLRECLSEERYCKVERVTYRSMTVSIERSCTQECWHGCHASGFGLTKLKCTSCCLESGCNIGDRAPTKNVCNILLTFAVFISSFTFKTHL